MCGIKPCYHGLRHRPAMRAGDAVDVYKRQYLKKENTTVQKRMNEALTELYERIVPEAVREFLDRKAPPPARPKRPARPGVEKPPEKAPRPEGQTRCV